MSNTETDAEVEADMVTVLFNTRIDLLWDEQTDQDKIDFAQWVAEMAAKYRAGEIKL